MATNTDRPVGPGTFRRDAHSVTIAADGKIHVKKDDWLSKYSWALYGDYETHDVFVRPNPEIVVPTQEIKGIKEIDNVDSIRTGEYLIHVPTYFHWAEKRGQPVYPRPRNPNDPKRDKQLQPSRVMEFFEYLRQWLCPVTEWDIKSSDGLDLSVAMFAGSGCDITAQRERDPEPTVFRAISAGFGFGPESIALSGSFSPPGYWSEGCIGKFAWAGRTLSADELCGGFNLLDFSAGFPIGWSMGVMLFGFKNPFHMAQTFWRYFHGTSDSLSFMPICKGALFMCGFNATTPSLGVSAKLGYMYKK